MLFNERVAIVRNFSPRSFFCATLVMNDSVFDDNVVVVNQNKWQARAFFGLRLKFVRKKPDERFWGIIKNKGCPQRSIP